MSVRDKPWALFVVGAIGAFVVLPLILRPLGTKWETAIYLSTGLVVLWYTIETFGMRREMVRQNEIAIQPVLIVFMENRQQGMAPGFTFGPQVILRNIGRGPALFIRVDDVNLTDPIGEVQFIAHFETADYLEPVQEATVRATMTYKTPVTEPNPRYLDFVASLNPETAVERYTVTVRYQDIGGRVYESVIWMGKGGIHLLSHKRVSARKADAA